MINTGSSSQRFNPGNIMVWILAPYLKTDDANLEYYYDYTQSIEEYRKVFETLNILWKWQPVTIHNFKRIIRHIETKSYPHTPVILNLCDGDEINFTPGISVIRELERQGLMYTGADEFFYDITTSKIPMKKLFELNEVPTPNWKVISNNANELDGVLLSMKHPVIIKPAVSGGSMGISVRSVVYNETALLEQLKILNEGYHGFDLVSGGIILEEFVDGPEFTVFIVGSSDKPHECKVYPPVERVFHHSLPESEKFLSFGRLWAFYDEENAMEDNTYFYKYHAPSPEHISELCKVSLDAYCAVKGEGYGRIDIRMDKLTGKMYVLEINAQCGLSEDENFTSIGAILRLSQSTFSDLIEEILQRVIEKNVLRIAV